MKRNFWNTILLAGFLVGSLDIIAAFINFYTKTGKNPVAVLNYIASAIFGRAAFSGDNSMAVWGLIFHFAIAFTWTILFFMIYPKIKLLSKNRILTGILYAIIIWLIMTQVIVPATKAPAIPFKADQALLAVGILIVAIGLPLSFIAYRYYIGKRRA